jgi:4-diphosphocytidyl-2-C-methyl-D-erythritol kinase
MSDPNGRCPHRLGVSQFQQPLGENAFQLHAPGKLNLNLLVGGRRTDGYHPLDSLVARISIYDRIELCPRRDGDIHFSCQGHDCGPADENLAFRAARRLVDGRGTPGVDILLHKEIPPGSGLGGGSSDAAAILAGLNELWGLALRPGELSEIGGELGSDVPVFLGPPASRMTGRGEHVQPVEIHSFLAVLILPDLVCSTSDVYRAFDTEPKKRPRQLEEELLRRPPSQWRDRLVNQLAIPAMRICPALEHLHAELSRCLPVPVCLTGSGSGMFALCDDEGEAAEMWGELPDGIRQRCMIVEQNPW